MLRTIVTLACTVLVLVRADPGIEREARALLGGLEERVLGFARELLTGEERAARPESVTAAGGWREDWLRADSASAGSAGSCVSWSPFDELRAALRRRLLGEEESR